MGCTSGVLLLIIAIKNFLAKLKGGGQVIRRDWLYLVECSCRWDCRRAAKNEAAE